MDGMVHPLAPAFDWASLHSLHKVVFAGDSTSLHLANALQAMCAAAGCHMTFVQSVLRMMPTRYHENATEFELILSQFFREKLADAGADTPYANQLVIANFGAWYNPEPISPVPPRARPSVMNGWSAVKNHESYSTFYALHIATNVSYRRDLQVFASAFTKHRHHLPPMAWRPTLPQHNPPNYIELWRRNLHPNCVPTSQTERRSASYTWRNLIANEELGATGMRILGGLAGPTANAWDSHLKILEEGGGGWQDCTHFCAASGISEWWAIYVLNWLVAWKRRELDAFEENLQWAEE